MVLVKVVVQMPIAVVDRRAKAGLVWQSHPRSQAFSVRHTRKAPLRVVRCQGRILRRVARGFVVCLYLEARGAVRLVGK